MEITPITTPEATLTEYGQRLKAHIKSSGESQESLAKEAGVGVATLRRMLAGRDATLSNWIKVLSRLNFHAQIEGWVPQHATSPLEEVAGRKRTAKVASGKPFEWGDEQ